MLKYENLKLAGGGLNGQDIFDKIISLENLYFAWREFRKGKRKKLDVQEFEYNLKDNILRLYQELKDKTYKHSNYISFYINDPKLRKIHKACVKDRVLHHAIFRILYPIFDKSFIFDSYSCRLGKGTHRAVRRLQEFTRKVSKNNSRNCFVLKCDIRKFFESIDQDILLDLIKCKAGSNDAIWLTTEVVRSFSKGLPLGNITSQLFANIYLNELDRFIKHELKVKYYIRYCDDFVILSISKSYLENLIPRIRNFLKDNLELFLHPNKITIRKYSQGIDFLGYVSFPHYKILRTKTKKRMLKKIKCGVADCEKGAITMELLSQTIQSYFGVLSHCDSYGVKNEVAEIIIGA